jgi:hypothetical protein
MTSDSDGTTTLQKDESDIRSSGEQEQIEISSDDTENERQGLCRDQNIRITTDSWRILAKRQRASTSTALLATGSRTRIKRKRSEALIFCSRQDSNIDHFNYSQSQANNPEKNQRVQVRLPWFHRAEAYHQGTVIQIHSGRPSSQASASHQLSCCHPTQCAEYPTLSSLSILPSATSSTMNLWLPAPIHGSEGTRFLISTSTNPLNSPVPGLRFNSLEA